MVCHKCHTWPSKQIWTRALRCFFFCINTETFAELFDFLFILTKLLERQRVVQKIVINTPLPPSFEINQSLHDCLKSLFPKINILLLPVSQNSHETLSDYNKYNHQNCSRRSLSLFKPHQSVLSYILNEKPILPRHRWYANNFFFQCFSDNYADLETYWQV